MTNFDVLLKRRATLLIALAILNVVIIFVMQSFGSALKPYSIIGFEYAGTPEKARVMIEAWQSNGVLDFVFFLTGFDYLFMITYSSFLWLACLSVGEGLSHGWSKFFIVLGWLQSVAAILDAIENLALYKILSGSMKPLWPTLSVVCATPKFAIALFAVIACAAGVIYKVLRKRSVS
jgi:hypothetical protein